MSDIIMAPRRKRPLSSLVDSCNPDEDMVSTSEGNNSEEAYSSEQEDSGTTSGGSDQSAIEIFHKGKWRWAVCRWIVGGDVPFTTVENPDWRALSTGWQPVFATATVLLPQ